MKRLECLDGLRGLLAVYVLLGHMAPFAMLPNWLQIAVSHGGAAVDVFFVLSGLVITQSLLRANGQAGPFLVARATRIFPVFLVVFAVAVVVDQSSCGFERMPWIGPENAARTICSMATPQAWVTEILAHVTMTHGLFPKAILPDVWVSFLGSAWSLSTEWQFYLLALAAGGGRRLCWLLLGLAMTGIIWRLALPEPWQFSRAFLANKSHFFALGVASLPVVRRETGALFRYGLVLTATLVICAAQGTAGKILPPLAWTACLVVQMLPPDTVRSHVAGWMLRNKVMQFLGVISYCLYLVNEPVHKLTASALSRFTDGNAMLFTLVWIPTAIGLPIVTSVWLQRYVEAPALRWGRSYVVRLLPRDGRRLTEVA